MLKPVTHSYAIKYINRKKKHHTKHATTNLLNANKNRKYNREVIINIVMKLQIMKKGE